MKSNLMAALILVPSLSLWLSISIYISPALAAPVWQPAFVPGQNVYLDPLLQSGPAAPVSLDGLPGRLASAAAKHALKPYFVMVKKGDDIANCHQKYAVCDLEQLVGQWSSHIDLNNYVLILVVRSDTDWTKVSYAINLGNYPRQLGVGPNTLNLDHWARGVDGGVAYLPRDPGNFAIHTLADVNMLIDAKLANRLAQAAHEQFVHALPGYLMLALGSIGLVLVSIKLSLRYKIAGQEAKATLEKWRQPVDNANNNFIRIQSAYFSFLNDQGDGWKSRFTGETLKSYSDAVGSYALLSSRIAVANYLLEQAQTAFRQANLFDTRGFSRVSRDRLSCR